MPWSGKEEEEEIERKNFTKSFGTVFDSVFGERKRNKQLQKNF
jgi:hypothetical protein